MPREEKIRENNKIDDEKIRSEWSEVADFCRAAFFSAISCLFLLC